MDIRVVSEVMVGGTVTHCIDQVIGGHQIVVSMDTKEVIEFYSCLFKTQIVYIRFPTHGEQHNVKWVCELIFRLIDITDAL